MEITPMIGVKGETARQKRGATVFRPTPKKMGASTTSGSRPGVSSGPGGRPYGQELRSAGGRPKMGARKGSEFDHAPHSLLSDFGAGACCRASHQPKRKSPSQVTGELY